MFVKFMVKGSFWKVKKLKKAMYFNKQNTDNSARA